MDNRSHPHLQPQLIIPRIFFSIVYDNIFQPLRNHKAYYQRNIIACNILLFEKKIGGLLPSNLKKLSSSAAYKINSLINEKHFLGFYLCGYKFDFTQMKKIKIYFYFRILWHYDYFSFPYLRISSPVGSWIGAILTILTACHSTNCKNIKNYLNHVKKKKHIYFLIS